MRTGKVVWSALLAFAGVCALPWMMKSGGNEVAFTNSIVTIFLFLGLGAFFYRIFVHGFQGKKSRWAIPAVFGLCFSFCMVMGTCLDEGGSVPFEEAGMWAAVLVIAVLMALIVRYVWDCLAHRLESKKKTGETERSAKGWVFYGGIIFLLYLPVFLAVYPGFFVYDAQDELLQVITRSFTTHHPLVHVLLLGGIIQFIYKLTGSYNLGIACYTWMQMAVMAGIFGWCVWSLRKRGLGKGFCILITVYFGICPVLVMFSLCSAKDGLFAGMLLLMTVFLSRLCREPEYFLEKKRNLFLLGGASLLMMLLRHNGVYAFLVSAVAIGVCFRKRKDGLKKLLIMFAGTFVVYLAINGGMAAVLSADASENQEILTVPIQQLARVYEAKERQSALDDKRLEKDLEILYQYLPPEALARYTPKVSDGVKIWFDNQAFGQDKGSFLRLWLKWGAQNPFTYLNAWFMTSYGYWYPDTVIDVYRGNTVFTYTYEDSSYFGYEVEEPGYRESKFPWLSEVYRKMSLEIFQQKIPVVSMLFSPGFLFWVWAFCLCFWWYQGIWMKVVPYLPIIFCFLTVLLGPTYLVRYVVYLWAVLPVLLAEFDNLQ